MKEIYEYLDKVKAEMEKLQTEYQAKTELFECLKKDYNGQLLKFEEAKLHIEKQYRLLDSLSEELSEAGQSIEHLKSSLHEKELSLKHLISANEKLHADYGEKLHKLEQENKEMVLALDEVSSFNKELKQKLCESEEEIVGLKRLLLDSEKKCLEAEKKAQASKELAERDDRIMKLEDNNRNVLEQLKWKQEQFNHLEEAHESLQDCILLQKEEWEREKLILLENISFLQTRLDSKIRTSKDLQTQLEMCNQALAHEESRRKLLEVQVSELESSFENVFIKSVGEKSKLENLSSERDDEIAVLRNLAAKKEALAEELEYKISHLEQKNWELEGSFKGIQEAIINNAGASLLKMLQNKIKGLEQEHSHCFTNLKAKESEWSSQMEQLKWKINSHECEMKRKEQQIKDIEIEVESLHCDVEILSQEKVIILMVLLSEFSEAYSNLLNARAKMELLDKEKEDKINLLTVQLEMTNSALTRTHQYMEEYYKEISSFLKKIESMDLIESIRRESEGAIIARLDSAKLCEQKKISLLRVTNEEEQCTEHLETQAASLEPEVHILHQELTYQEFSSHLKQEVLHFQKLLEANKVDTEYLVHQLGKGTIDMECRVKKLEYEGRMLQDAMKQNVDREDMFAQVEEVYDQMNRFSCEDVKLMKHLETILKISEDECRPGIDLKASNELCDSSQDNTFCPLTIKFEAGTDERSPLKELNH